MTTRTRLQYTLSMNTTFSLSNFNALFTTDEACLEEIKRIRFPQGIYCVTCEMTTGHYKVAGRTAYSCGYCRTHFYPLIGTIFEKSSTGLRLWFYAMYLLLCTKGNVSAKQLQRELGVTYKTAWRIHNQIYLLLSLNNGDLLMESGERVHKWLFFNKIEFKVVHKKEDS